jgi:hypothetical protein
MTVEEDVEFYGKEAGEESDEDEGFDQSTLAIAAAAEDELLLAQARSGATRTHHCLNMRPCRCAAVTLTTSLWLIGMGALPGRCEGGRRC